MNLGPLFTGLAKGVAGYRRGQVAREEIDREQEQRKLRDMLAIYAEQRQREAETSRQFDRDRTFNLRQSEANKPPAPPAPQIVRTAKGIFTLGRDGTLTPLQDPGGGGVLTEPSTPRNIDPLSPEGIKASSSREETLQRIRARFEKAKAPKAADVPAFLRPGAARDRAATLSTQARRDEFGEPLPPYDPAEAAAQAHADLRKQRDAAFQVEAQELMTLYRRAFQNASTPEEKERATKAYETAQADLLTKYGIKEP